MQMLKLLLLSFIISLSAQANEPYFCSSELGRLPVQQGGRVKPLYVHAGETIKYVTGERKIGDYDAVTAYCLLSLQGMGLTNSLKATTKVEHVDLKKFLGMEESEHTYELAQLVDQMGELRLEWRQAEEDSSYKKALNTLLGQVALYNDIASGNNWTFPEPAADGASWFPLVAFLTETKVAKAKSEGSDQPFITVMNEASKFYETKVDDMFVLEYHYAKAHLPGWAMLLSLLGLAALVLFKRFKVALFFAGSAILVQTALITLRVIISGRGPVTNMYETVLFSGWGALVLGLAIGHFRKEKAFVYVGLAYNVMTMMMMNFATGMLSERISPLVPVLRDNFWLSTHVTTIIISYGALAMSWVLANTVLIKRSFGGGISAEDERYFADLTYTCMKWGTVLLAAGVILGGVWADYSWGRFWGWDPKETWSLIVLCLYMAILHGRYTAWIPPRRFATLVAAAFMSVMMAWFGVNYILASGLHSYGFSEGGAIFLGTFFLVQIALIAITSLKSKFSAS
tara:strand:+ start:11752 stop:13290 length:1539 start_codon:yes stop_codon:yes gene_type:complete